MASPSDRSYLLCATPRTGSTRLCRLLNSTGVAGRPESYFRAPDRARWAEAFGVPIDDDEAFEAGARRTGSTPNGIFGARVMWGSMEPLVLATAGDSVAYVHVVRADVVAQAVSWARAEQTGHWQDGDASSAEPVLDLAQVDALVRTIEEHNDAWHGWFDERGVAPVVVTYDDVVERPGRVVACVLDAVRVAVPDDWRAVTVTRHQADDVSADWVRRYRAARPATRSSPR